MFNFDLIPNSFMRRQDDGGCNGGCTGCGGCEGCVGCQGTTQYGAAKESL